jgi:small subunit ribosomal protein S6
VSTIEQAKNYEMTVIIDPRIEENEVDKEIEIVKELIVQHKGEVQKVESWGKKRLAYEIKKLHEGFYFIITFSAPGKSIREIEEELKLKERLLRVFTVKQSMADIR